MHGRRALAALLVLGAVAVLPPGDGQGVTSPLGLLLARHVPILILHPSERFAPVAVDGFLADSDLQQLTSAGWEKLEGPLPAGGTGLRLDQRLCSAREGVAATSCYASAQSAHPSAPVVYGAALRRGSRVDLRYWLWYPFNPYSPTLPPGELWQVHEGDWEAISVIVDRAGKPLVVGYSQHSEGVRRAWSAAPKRGPRPLVYVALGSHANYPAPGTHRFDPRVVSPLFISVIEQNGQRPVDHAGRGRVVRRPRLVRVSATAPSWMRFAGRWGEDEYLRVPAGQPVASGGGGPRGLAYHEQWQRPVREVLSWPRG